MTLDDDVAAAVESLQKERSIGKSQAINDLIRAGLNHKPTRKPFKQRSEPIGLLIDVNNVAEALEYLEGPWHR